MFTKCIFLVFIKINKRLEFLGAKSTLFIEWNTGGGHIEFECNDKSFFSIK